ncbi:Ribosomal_S13 domain-containing protein [Cephalotus follicularis]|uniref:Ribosomal_S13 domain-containing protein n=1 Tax=Cephalotus follicularis TaxID=3775 RepID=A0A1Q3C7S2_CEPFO|nr:Ribosomal_S13 domain-containing protein [Cephalotus follicularis]
MLGVRCSVGKLSDIGLRLLENTSFHGLRVRCLRVGNTEIPDNKKLEVALQHIHGIGRNKAHRILCDLNIENKLTRELSGRELNSLRDELSRYLIGEDLRRCIRNDIARLVGIQCYRGIRHADGLPCRGQRTSTNARTAKGKKGVGILNIRCARVGGVEIPNNKRVEYSLQYIHGIGRTRSRQILNDLNMENKITKDLSEEELVIIRDEVSKYMIEGELKRFNQLNINRLKEIQCYRGIRHIKGLPCRGQRTKNNCRTLKGKRVAIAGKKKAPR